MTSTSWKQEFKETMKLGLPLALTQLGIIALNTIDVMFIGRLGPESLAASALASSMWATLYLFCTGVLSAVPALAAQAVGAKKSRSARRIVRQGIWVALSLCIPFCILLLQTEQILLLVGQEAHIAQLASVYMNTLLWSIIPSTLIFTLRGYMSAYGVVRPALFITFAAIPLNTLLDYALIFGKFGLPRFELWGAGLATTIVHTVAASILILYLVLSQKFKRKAVLARIWRSDWARYKEILTLGTPIGILLVSEVGLFTATTFVMGTIGTIELAAHQIAFQLAAITFMVPLGISQAATIRVGHAMGRKQLNSAKRAAFSSLAMGAGIMAVIALFMLTFPTFLISQFLDSQHQDTATVTAFGVSFLLFAALFQLSDGIQVIAGGILRGMTDTKIPMLIGVLGYWGIGFSSGYILAFQFNMNGNGIWTGLLIGLTACAFLYMWRIRFLWQKLVKSEEFQPT